MKRKQLILLLIAGFAVVSAHGQVQPTPPGAATSPAYPTGAIVEDSLPVLKESRRKSRMTKRSNRKATNQNARRNAETTSQEGRYRQRSAANGTAVNNSNSTNHNSDNATNNATGVGSNPAVSTNPTTPSGSPTTATSGVNNGEATSETTKTGTAAAVSGARTTTSPAVVAGSTERNTSIHDFIASSPNYTTLQNALQSADLNELFKGNESYTLFAPSNSAFKKLPVSVQAGLLEGRNREALKQLLSYHVVKGSVDAKALIQQIKSGNGKALLRTMAGGTLTAQVGSDERVTITDEQGETAIVDMPDQLQSNGVIHGLNTVLLPKSGAEGIR